MSVRGGLLLTTALLLLCATILGACGPSQDSVYLSLTPGPTPPADPGTYVWACGSPDFIMGSADGGATWQVRHRNPDMELTAGLLWAITFGDRNHGWAVARGTSSTQARVLATVDAGKTWETQYPGVNAGWLRSVTATDADHVWAAGFQSLNRFGSQGKPLMLASADAGKTWRRQRLPAGLVPSAVAFADVRHGWALAADDASHYHVISTSDGGAHWRDSYTAASGVILNGLAAVGPRRCWAVGYDQEQHLGLIVSIADGGRDWTAQSPVPQHLKAVSFPDARNGWTVGEGGTVLVTHDGGAKWSRQHSGLRWPLSQVSFSDVQHGWALIDGTAFLSTLDGGKSWSVVRPKGLGDVIIGITSFDARETGK